MVKKQIEDIILQHSARGMDKLRPYLADSFCQNAAQAILSWPRGAVLLTTGFYVAGYAETDGPAGTVTLALALQKLGFRAVIVTDTLCRGFFECKDLETVYMRPEDGWSFCRRLLDRYRPVGLISVERCGKNGDGDYANMRGVSIRTHTAPVDRLFELAHGEIPTVGIGDGGNEIGMGCLQAQIRQELGLNPCHVPVDHLIIATVSNWGAYGLTACLSRQSGLPLLPARGEVETYLRRTVAMGSVDGLSGRAECRVDGFPLHVELDILEELAKAV